MLMQLNQLFWVNSVRYRYAVRLCNMVCNLQGDHLSGKPGNVRDFDSFQGFY